MNKTKITRNDIWEWFRADNARLDPQLIRQVFEESSDIDLSKSYNLKILRPGVFYY